MILERTNARFEITRMIPDQISFPLSLITNTYVVLRNDVGYVTVILIFPILYHFESSLPPSTIRRQSAVSKELYGQDFLLLVLASRVDICFNESGWAI